MALYKATVYCRDPLQAIDQEYQHNCWVDNDISSEAALIMAEGFANALAIVMADEIELYRITVSNPDAINGHQSILTPSLVGLRTASGSRLPSWNTVLVQGQPETGGRPSTWHFRIGLSEGDVTGQNLETTLATLMATFTGGSGLGSVAGLVNAQGVPFGSFSFDELVRNRQQGWHRRTRVGFHRGWVPNT